jgi:ABC-type glutathione transport system ATPase component
MTHPAIEVRGLRKMFKKRTGLLKSRVSEEWALNGVSFEVAQGEAHGEVEEDWMKAEHIAGQIKGASSEFNL